MKSKAEIALSIIKSNVVILHHCCKCGCRITAYFDEDYDLNGNWMTLQTHWSELFNTFVADPTAVVCHRCWSTGGF